MCWCLNNLTSTDLRLTEVGTAMFSVFHVICKERGPELDVDIHYAHFRMPL